MHESDDDIPNAQLCYIREESGDLLDGLGGEPAANELSLRKDKVAYGFMEKESEHLEFFGGKKKPDLVEFENEFIDLVVRWKMPKQRKQGFFTLFGVHLLKKKKQVTNNAGKLIKRVSGAS